MSDAVEFPVDRSPRAVRRRLWNPPNGRDSSELEIMSEPARRRQRTQAAARQLEQMREARVQKAADLLIEYRERLARWAATAIDPNDPDAPEIPRTTVGLIVRAVSEHFQVRQVDLVSARRTARVVLPRQVIMYLAREYTGMSLPQIGKRVGGRDHTTVLYAWQKISALVENGDEQLLIAIAAIRKRLGI